MTEAPQIPQNTAKSEHTEGEEHDHLVKAVKLR